MVKKSNNTYNFSNEIIYCVLQNHEKTTVVVKVRIRFDPKVLGNEITSRTT